MTPPLAQGRGNQGIGMALGATLLFGAGTPLAKLP